MTQHYAPIVVGTSGQFVCIQSLLLRIPPRVVCVCVCVGECMYCVCV